MTEPDILVVEGIIERVSNFNRNSISKSFVVSIATVIDQLLYSLNETNNKITSNIEQAVKSQINLSASLKETNRLQSFAFNPLSFFRIGETMHSFLIAKLLDPNGEHGQGQLFLKCFLEMLGIEIHQNENWIVTSEIGRIDILIKRKFPHAAIVIENKSNYAVDQENQLYRYWYQEIILPNNYREDPIKFTTNNPNYQIIYLTPTINKTPIASSLSQPMDFDSSLPKEIPIVPTIWTFNDHIRKWLTKSIEKLPSENHRMREYIKQYIELWT